ncbi:PREDICTED: chromodomain-helicase-DNA-binding protein 1-like isoform X2 [Amphimedon queenslandica]|uniref:BRCT domain-containing protein n=1 Tax=Amphimedon queenslandica TaxID=400682 RepID=A0AAN0JTH6_AMPQE|nr:PREDICTED: chromodomain-helicase-DNA-binding protein 1-like isoform X2 [Amphimedon queenslandica]|eukprot:XP_019860346.1 PREDICTED: chromodomain-helicase-DNA-binding protein 1-like isoform X2 [Amphimedon queenslandica]
MQPETYYKKASKMRDLSLSDVHVIPVDDIMSRDQGRDMLALIVAQSRDSSGSLSGIKLPSLNIGLQRISSLALRLNASVHLPRIGHSTPHFNWYGTERLIRKHLSSKGIPTFIYYFPRHGHHKTIPRVSPELRIKVDPLPDTFTNISVCFYGIDESTKLSLSRCIIAYNGDVEEAPTDKTTHIIVPGLEGNKLPWNTHKATVVSLKWLEDSLHEGHLLQTEKYLIHHLV